MTHRDKVTVSFLNPPHIQYKHTKHIINQWKKFLNYFQTCRHLQTCEFCKISRAGFSWYGNGLISRATIATTFSPTRSTCTMIRETWLPMICCTTTAAVPTLRSILTTICTLGSTIWHLGGTTTLQCRLLFVIFF